MAHYRITPLEKKSVEAFFELYRKDPNSDNIQWVNISETYRWGKAFVAEDFDSNLPFEDAKIAYGRMDDGESESCDFEDSISVDFEFSDDISEEEQELIKSEFYEGGLGWIFDGDHDWEIEDEYVMIYAPYKIELCDESGTVLQEVNPRKRGE